MAYRLQSFNNGDSERALLVGTYSSKSDRHRQAISLEELSRLAETAGALVTEKQLHELRSPQPATYLGKGKIDEIFEEVQKMGLDVVILDEDLSPTQNRNLEKLLGVKVIDRTGLILDIFARRARTREGKIQVEVAQLRYLLPRLAGKGKEFSQLAGGIGTRGPGETKLEMDRRKARQRLSLLQRDLKSVRTHRALHRKKRTEVPLPVIALVGYTNSGKSTLMNRLTDAGVLVEDKLFATLDPTVRRIKLPSGREILLVDTVGLVRKLPHTLVEAFRATFEEVGYADLLIHLIDISHPHVNQQISVVEQVLEEFHLDNKPILRVFNKTDKINSDSSVVFLPSDLSISALTGEGLNALAPAIEEKLSETLHHLSLSLPYDAGSELSLLYRTGRVLKREDRPEGVHLEVEVNGKYFNKFRRYE